MATNTPGDKPVNFLRLVKDEPAPQVPPAPTFGAEVSAATLFIKKLSDKGLDVDRATAVAAVLEKVMPESQMGKSMRLWLEHHIEALKKRKPGSYAEMDDLKEALIGAAGQVRDADVFQTITICLSGQENVQSALRVALGGSAENAQLNYSPAEAVEQVMLALQGSPYTALAQQGAGLGSGQSLAPVKLTGIMPRGFEWPSFTKDIVLVLTGLIVGIASGVLWKHSRA